MDVVNDRLMTMFEGKCVKLTLKTSSFSGVVQRINPNKTLVLAEVELVNEANAEVGDVEEHKSEDYLHAKQFQPYRRLLDDDDEHINFVVIDEFHEKFGPAVMHIKMQQVVGVGVDGVDIHKHGRLCWLQIATKNKVYLFDILLLGARAFRNGLSMILQDQHILKVIHDCRAVAGCLVAQFGVKLTNVFDTQAADVMCFYSETGGLLPDRVSTLQEVVSLHLKVSSSKLSLLQMKSQEESEVQYKRPCPSPLLKWLAVSVIHLQPLRLVLLDTLMMDYRALVDSLLSSSLYAPDDLQLLSMESWLELPREFRQLEEIRREKQERATRRYPVTREGLLARFSPTAPSQTWPASEEFSSTRTDAPATVASPSPPRAHLHPPPRGHSMAPDDSSAQSADAPAPPDRTPPNPAPHTLSWDLGNAVVSPSRAPGAGRDHVRLLMDIMGRGRSFGREPAPAPAMGRGFLPRIPASQNPRRQEA